jgi:hypothetical protein
LPAFRIRSKTFASRIWLSGVPQSGTLLSCENANEETKRKTSVEKTFSIKYIVNRLNFQLSQISKKYQIPHKIARKKYGNRSTTKENLSNQTTLLYNQPAYNRLMKKLLLIFGLLLFSPFSFAQIDIYRSHSSFIPAINFSKTQPKFRNSLLFLQDKPLISQYLPKRRDCYYLLASQTSICFNREINMDAMSRQTKQLFFKMKMWGWFVGRTERR